MTDARAVPRAHIPRPPAPPLPSLPVDEEPFRVVRHEWRWEEAPSGASWISAWWEFREVVDVIVECPTCGADIELTAETDGWTETDDGSAAWQHDSYGPSLGTCAACDPDGERIVADWWEGSFVFERHAGGPRA